MGASREILDGFEDAFLNLFQWALGQAGEDFLEARYAEQSVFGVHGFRDPVAEKHERVAGLQFEAGGCVLGLRNQPNGERAFRESFLGDTVANQERRRMAGVDEFEVAIIIKNAEEHGGVAAYFGVAAEKAIDVIEHPRGVGTEGHGGKRALQHGGEQGSAEAFAGDIGNEKGCAAFANRKDIEVVPTDGQTGQIVAIDGEMREFAEIPREKPLLNSASDIDLLFEALAFALALDQASVIQNAGGVGGQGVKNLAIQLGEGRGPARIQIEHAEKIASLDIDHGLLRVRKFDGGLAGREAFGRKTQAAASAREFYFQGASGIGFEQKAAIGVRDRDGMVQHVAEHHVQGELRV